MFPSIPVQCFSTDLIKTDLFVSCDNNTLLNSQEEWKSELLEENHLGLKHISFDGDVTSAKDICSTLHNLPFLQSLKLTSVKDVVPVLRKICRSNKHLEKLILKDCTSKAAAEIPETALINILISLPDLRCFELNKIKFKSHKFYESLARLSNIISFDISSNEFVTLGDLMVLTHNCKLQEFKMSRRYKESKISDMEMAHLINSMKSQLTLLYLDMSGLSNFTYNEILCCSKLIDLKLNNAMNLSRELFWKLPRSLRYLQHLKIEGPSLLTHGDFYTSFKTVINFGNQLDTLKLQGFDCLTDTECCEILDTCLNLKSLSLERCKSLTVEGLSKSLMKLGNLSQLNVSFIGKSAGIENTMLHLPNLNSLSIDESSYVLNKLPATCLKKPKKNIVIIHLEKKL